LFKAYGTAKAEHSYIVQIKKKAMSLIQEITTNDITFYNKKGLPNLAVGDTVKVTIFLELPKNDIADDEKKEKERIQTYEGVIISKHRSTNSIDSTITVRKMFQGGGIEKVFLLNSPWVKNIECITSAKVRRSRLYYLRERRGKSARLKRLF
jgi:large subunit ribosomal protein L19